METIISYLESMFRLLPQSQKVLRAKSELLQMMEDKYTELINNGVSENEAIGTVISEFGNLDELAQDFGITEEITAKKDFSQNSRKMTYEEVTGFLDFRKKASIFRGIGIALCICCVIPIIIMDALNISDTIGVCLMFIFIACGVGLIIYSNANNQEWKFLYTQICSIDDNSYELLKRKKHNFMKLHSIYTSIAIMCFICCCIPAIIFDYFNSNFMDELGVALLFLFVAAGVYLLIYTNMTKSSFNFLLDLNNSPSYFEPFYTQEKETNSNPYYTKTWTSDDKEEKSHSDLKFSHIKNTTIRKILSVYWFTITCIYLCWSFLSFRWYLTWIIWPIAAVVFTIIKLVASKDDDIE